MFLDDLKSLIKRFEELEVENRRLKKEIKRLHKSDRPNEVKTEKKEKTRTKNEKTPSLF
jgi:uncharacterized protein (UPF0335 family)